MLTTLLVMIIYVYIVNNRAQGPEWPIAFGIKLLTYLLFNIIFFTRFVTLTYYEVTVVCT